MQVFDRIDPQTLDRRDWQLWLLALAMILILAGGVGLLMYPSVFSSPEALSRPTLRKIFFGFCTLCLLLVGYLMNRQLEIRRLRSRLAEEERQITRLREQASTDLLSTLPGPAHFQDRLAMEFRRSTNIQEPLSVLVVGLKPSRQFNSPGEIATAFGDGAKATIRKLRGEDSIFLFRPGVFGIILPGVRGTDASRVAARLAEGLTDASGTGNRFSFDIQMINYPEHVATAREMEKTAVSSFVEKELESQPG